MSSENPKTDKLAKQFFVQRSTKVFGPFSQRQIEKGKLDGKFLPTDKVSCLPNGPWLEIATANLSVLGEAVADEQVAQEIFAAEVVHGEAAAVESPTAASVRSEVVAAEVVTADIVVAPQTPTSDDVPQVVYPTWKFVAAVVGSGAAACFVLVLFVSWALTGGADPKQGEEERVVADVTSSEEVPPLEEAAETEVATTGDEKVSFEQAMAEFGQAIEGLRVDNGAESEVSGSYTPTTSDDSYSELDASLQALSPDEGCERATAIIADTSNTDSLRTAYLLAHKAASAGHARSKFILGMCYFAGWGVEVDDAAGMYWLEAAANQEEPQAMYMVAGLIQEGRFPEKGTSDILYLLNRSAEAGYAPAVDALNEYKVQQVNGLIGALFLSAFSSGDSGSYDDTEAKQQEMWDRRENERRYWTTRAENAAANRDQADYDYSRNKIP